MSKTSFLDCVHTHTSAKCNSLATCYCVRLLPAEQEETANTSKICKASPKHTLLARVGTEETEKMYYHMMQLK